MIEKVSSALVWSADKCGESDVAKATGSRLVLSQKPIWKWGEVIGGHVLIR